jgi:midasin (ATPase involved in ribosome maturation)
MLRMWTIVLTGAAHPAPFGLHAGCGKSALVGELVRVTGNTDLITVHVDDQMDSKTLLGCYIATTTPGEFIWQAGLLTQASSFAFGYKASRTHVNGWHHQTVEA